MKFVKKLKVLLVAICFSGSCFAADTKPLSFATEATYPPFESINNQGQMVGFDVDILKAICNVMQKTCNFVNQPWDSLIPGLELGKFDVIFGAMNITDERRKQVDFTQPYFTSSGTLVATKSSNFSLDDPKTVQGKTIGVQGSTTYQYYLQAKYGNTIRINRYGSIQDAFLDLQSGRVDAVFGDTPIVLSWLKNPSNSAYAPMGTPVKDAKFFSQGYGFAVKKGNAELLNQLNNGLQTIKANGSYQLILQKYFGTMQ